MATKANSIVSVNRPAGEHMAEEYWTEELRRSVPPIRLPVARAKAGAAAKAPAPSGDPGHTPHSRGSAEEPKTPLAPRGTGGFAVPTPLAYPFRTNGRLFGTLPNGDGFSGSASLISPNILLTAGHCVFTTAAVSPKPVKAGWNGNLVFYPSYPLRSPRDPYYKFGWNSAACWTAWSQNTNFAFDYAMIWIDAAPGNALGWLGTLWNASTSGRTWTAIGYPALPNPPFNGNAMDEATGQYGGSDESGTFILSNDNMSHGSSGGPWITTWNESSPTHANSDTSNIDGNGNLSGPYYTQDLNNLFNWISNPANRA
jgi:V8-like Glu-specific endopeptidase